MSLLICLGASALRPVFEPDHLLQFVQLRRHSSTVRTLLCPGEARDHDPLAVYGSILIINKNKKKIAPTPAPLAANLSASQRQLRRKQQQRHRAKLQSRVLLRKGTVAKRGVRYAKPFLCPVRLSFSHNPHSPAPANYLLHVCRRILAHYTLATLNPFASC